MGRECVDLVLHTLTLKRLGLLRLLSGEPSGIANYESSGRRHLESEFHLCSAGEGARLLAV